MFDLYIRKIEYKGCSSHNNEPASVEITDWQQHWFSKRQEKTQNTDPGKGLSTKKIKNIQMNNNNKKPPNSKQQQKSQTPQESGYFSTLYRVPRLIWFSYHNQEQETENAPSRRVALSRQFSAITSPDSLSSTHSASRVSFPGKWTRKEAQIRFRQWWTLPFWWAEACQALLSFRWTSHYLTTGQRFDVKLHFTVHL